MNFDRTIVEITALDLVWPREGMIAVVQSNPTHDRWVMASVPVTSNLGSIECGQSLLHLVRSFRLLLPNAMQVLSALGPSNQIGSYRMWCSTRNAFIVYNVEVSRCGLRMRFKSSDVHETPAFIVPRPQTVGRGIPAISEIPSGKVPNTKRTISMVFCREVCCWKVFSGLAGSRC